MAFPIPSSGLAVIGPRLWSLRLFYQQPGGPIGQAVHVDGAWSQAPSTFSAVPLSPLAAITWNTGKEVSTPHVSILDQASRVSRWIRAYYLDEQYIVQEYCFTEGHGWYKGQTGELKAKASPQSRLGAIIYHHEGHNHIRVYYQGEYHLSQPRHSFVETAEEDKTHVVRELAYDGKWHMGEMQIKNAIEGTGIASVTYIANAQRQIRVYYQSPDLLLREYCHNNKGWFAGKFTGHVCPHSGH